MPRRTEWSEDGGYGVHLLYLCVYEHSKIFKTLLSDKKAVFRRSFRKPYGNLPGPECGNQHVGSKMGEIFFIARGKSS